MRRRIALLVAWVCVPTVAETGLGQDRVPPTLFSQCTAVDLELVFGRLQVVPRHRGQVRLTSPTEEPARVRESLVVNNDGGAPLVRYERVDEQGSLVVEVLHYNRLTMRRTTEDPTRLAAFEFTQPDHGDLRLIVGQGDGSRELTAPSLWHLLFLERQLGEETVISVLEQLRPDWRLARMCERLEAELFDHALADRPVSRQQIEQLVADLDAPEFRRRQLADRRLRSFGPLVVPYLDSAVATSRSAGRRLSGEQRERIQAIRQALVVGGEDSPERVAQWLADDEQAWLALLRHHDPLHRHLAALRLAALRPEASHFDPYGDETYRQRQLAELRLQIRR